MWWLLVTTASLADHPSLPNLNRSIRSYRFVQKAKLSFLFCRWWLHRSLQLIGCVLFSPKSQLMAAHFPLLQCHYYNVFLLRTELFRFHAILSFAASRPLWVHDSWSGLGVGPFEVRSALDCGKTQGCKDSCGLWKSQVSFSREGFLEQFSNENDKICLPVGVGSISP